MKHLYLLFLALPLLVVGCKKETPAPTAKQPTFELTSEATMTFEAAGGEDEIAYNLVKGDEALDGESGPISQPSPVRITTNVDWIKIISEESYYGIVKFSVDDNTTQEERTGVIKLAYWLKELQVTIKQNASSATEPGPEPEPSFEGWGIVGTMNDWDATKAIIMEQVDGYYVSKSVELTTTDKFKFVKNGDNALNRGGNGQEADPDYFYTAQSWGSDIHVSVDGTFDIYLNSKEDTYYIMSEGKSPVEALEPLAPGEDLYEVYGNFEGEKARLTTEKRYMVAKGVAFNDAVAEFDIRMNENAKTFGAKEDATYVVEEQIEVAEGDTKIKVAVEAGTKYDIYYRTDLSSLWLMPAGEKPLSWEEATGIAFSSTNFAINLKGEGLELFFDFYCGEAATNDIIPEATYYVDNEDDGGYNFNLDNEYDIRIEGFKTKLKSGTMVVKHISGGYDITVDVESIHNHVVKAHYAGPIEAIDIMGRPITNPE